MEVAHYRASGADVVGRRGRWSTATPCHYRRIPGGLTVPFRDENARIFGDFGGHVVPESLVRRLDELSWEPGACERRAGVPRRARRSEPHLHRPARDHQPKLPVRAHAGGCPSVIPESETSTTQGRTAQHVLGQAILTKGLADTGVIAENGAGQPWVGTAKAARSVRLGVRHLHGRGRHELQA